MDKQILDQKLKKLCKKSKAVGVNVALFDRKGIIYNYNYGFANKEERIKSDNDSLYMIGSNTKVMTALGILKLREEGKLSLDDDIKKFIPEFEVKSYFEYDKITIENLLMHRSGLVSDLFQLILDRTRDYHEVIAELKDTYLTAEPGKCFLILTWVIPYLELSSKEFQVYLIRNTYEMRLRGLWIFRFIFF